MEDYYEYLDSNGVTTLYKLIKDDTVALIDSYSVTINGITTNLDNHVNNSDIHTPITDIENMVDTKVSGLVNSAPETLDTLKELSDALGNDPNFATTVANQIGNKASKDDVYTKEETDTLLEGKANSVHSHVVSDITDFPTIPTKLSQLENDMGFGSGSGGVIASISWTNITDKPNFATVATSGSYTDLSNTPTIPTKVSQLENDTGFINALTDVVDTKSNQTIGGTKTFTNQLYLGAGGTSYGQISAKDNNSILRLFGGASAGTGANLDLYGEGLSDGGFSLRARTSDKIVSLDGKVDGTLKWNGKNVALDENLVHRTGNETINGSKSFTGEIYRMNNAVDRTTTPSQNLYSSFTFLDKARLSVGSIQHCQRTSGINDLSFYVTGNSNVSYGVRINSNKEFSPIENNTYSLGSSSYKWANVYATTFKGNLKGNADSATKASYLDNYSLPGGNKIYLDWSGQKKGYVGLKVDNTVMGGLITTNNIGSQAVKNADSAGNGIDSSGTNYVKFKDGTQICWGSNKGGDIITFANAFTSTPCISFGYNIGSDFDEIIHGQARYSSSTSFIMDVWNLTKNIWEDRSCEWIAIGRWK